jgi:hypothetical protein
MEREQVRCIILGSEKCGGVLSVALKSAPPM